MFVLNGGVRDDRIILVVTMEPDEVEDALAQAHFEVAVAEGLAPRDGLSADEACIEKLGVEEASRRFTEVLMANCMPLVCDHAHAVMVGQPECASDAPAEPGAEFTFTAQFACMPKIDLVSYEPVSLDMGEPSVSDEAVEQYVTELVEQVGGSLTDEWVASRIPTCSTVRSLLSHVRREFERRAQRDFDEQCAYEAMRQMAGRLSQDVPDAVFQAAYDEALSQLSEAAEQRDLPAGQMVEADADRRDSLEEGLAEQVRERLACEIALDAVIRHEGLTLSEEDVMRYLKTVAAGNEEAYQLDLLQKGGMQAAKRAALHMKAGAWLVDAARAVQA